MPALGEIRHALWFKLTAAFLLVAAAGVIIVAILANRATIVGFRHYLNQNVSNQWADLQLQLALYYDRQGNWEGVESLLVAAGPGRGQGGGSLVLLASDGQVVALAGGRRNYPTSAAEADVNLPILVDGQQAGTLLVKQPGGGGGGGGAGEQFLVQVNNAIWWGGLAAVLLALFLGVFLARRLTQPLRQLTEATRKMARGELGQQVSTIERGEIGELSTSFNQMSVALAASEQQRQQMLADVAHELRTPLSITQGHIEAMLDGVFEMTPENLALVHEETLLLGRLVDDLRTLSLAEAGQLSLDRVTVNLSDLMVQSVSAFEPLAEAEGVVLTAEVPAEAVMITADPSRIRQVLGNLLSNALRHVSAGENSPPQVTLSLFNRGDVAQLRVSDNGPGLSPEAQKHIFDRFWRADRARSRDQGGSGLGLAICRAIVDAHAGRIWVKSTAGQGATFIVELPAVKENETRAKGAKAPRGNLLCNIEYNVKYCIGRDFFMKSIVFFVLLIGSVLSLAACSSAGSDNVEATTTQTATNNEPSNGMMGMGGSMMARHHASIPNEYAGLTNPMPADDASIERGGEIYVTNCASCHGDGGMGDGPAAAGLDPAPAPIAHTSQMLGDDYLYWRVSEGGAMEPFNSTMIAWKTVLDEDDRWDVINYVQALGSGQVMPQQGMGGAAYDPDAEEERQAEMLAEAVAQGVITEEEAVVFAATHGLVDGQMIRNREGASGNMDYRMADALAELVVAGKLTQAQADTFASVHDRLAKAGLMQ